MTEETSTADPYEAVLADLKGKRDKIDQAIALLEGLRGMSVPAFPESGRQPPAPTEIEPHTFHGMSIPEAAKKLLLIRKKDLGNQDLAVALRAGGLILQSENPANTIGSILTRRFQQIGDIVRVGRGTWGLKEWHPTIRFTPKNGKKEEGEPTTEIRRPRPRLPLTENEEESS